MKYELFVGEYVDHALDYTVCYVEDTISRLYTVFGHNPTGHNPYRKIPQFENCTKSYNDKFYRDYVLWDYINVPDYCIHLMIIHIS